MTTSGITGRRCLLTRLQFSNKTVATSQNSHGSYKLQTTLQFKLLILAQVYSHLLFSLRHLVPGVVQSCDGEVKEGTNYCPQRVETVQLG